eukprot:CAMPEP_0204424958 /NCGR_PEP_ID=MMETSP0470-20130426/47590_1 /ASSEMBLY_ACC=CAM_ASM_000385 /TAXON_ID=2969 /ORGANISM="Oxyrrhis marina" /LENGTH=141 /DNA_ID=CAMNT_0051422533 /DNA_START=207 /DNA_END=630 /DNA_ORIENTATION=+
MTSSSNHMSADLGKTTSLQASNARIAVAKSKTNLLRQSPSPADPRNSSQGPPALTAEGDPTLAVPTLRPCRHPFAVQRATPRRQPRGVLLRAPINFQPQASSTAPPPRRAEAAWAPKLPPRLAPPERPVTAAPPHGSGPMR